MFFNMYSVIQVLPEMAGSVVKILISMAGQLHGSIVKNRFVERYWPIDFSLLTGCWR